MKASILYTDYNQCFFCNSKNFGEVVNFKYLDNFYTKIIKEKYSVTSENIQSKLRLRKCNDCNSFTFDRWFSQEAKEIMYNFQKHRMGWHKFTNTIFTNNSQLLLNDAEMFLKISQEIGIIRNYAELMCPFMGMYPMFSYIRNRTITNQKFFSTLYSSLVIFLLKIIKKKNLNREIENLINKVNLPEDNIFFQIETCSGWNKHCSYLGYNCKEIIKKNSWVKIKSNNHANDLNKKIDLLYLYNTLDHLDNPLIVLENLTGKIKNIFIEFHNLSGGAQHSYFLTPETMNFISKKLSFKIKKIWNNNQYLLSK
jgi:hypothetical protein